MCIVSCVTSNLKNSLLDEVSGGDALCMICLMWKARPSKRGSTLRSFFSANLIQTMLTLKNSVNHENISIRNIPIL